MKNLTSVIIPVYNDQNSLDRCLEALENQSLSVTEFEVIVVDNGSKTAMVVTEDCRLATRIVVCSKPGSYATRNTGMKVARGDILALLDADCIPDTNWLENGRRALKSRAGKCLVGGEVEYTKSTNPGAVELYQRMTGFGQEYNIKNKYFSATANIFIKSKDAKAIGEFNEDLLSGGDLDWSWRAKEKGIKLIYAADVVVTTPPRKSLRAAIKQARRIAGGRQWFKNNFPEKIKNKQVFIAPRRGNLESICWILSRTEQSLNNRIRILLVAIIIKIAQILEIFRLKLGGQAERL